MNKAIWQRLLPHVIAIVIFLLLALFFCRPALESDTVMKQSDIAGWQGMSHQSFQYKETYGHFPLWATNMFSGMPAFQIAQDGPWTILVVVNKVFQFGLPKPMNFFFLACIGFYFLCLCLKIRPWVGIIGAIGFAYSLFSPIIVSAGHDTQMLALAYAPTVLGSVILLFDKKYITGFILTLLFTALEIQQNHQQISYYLLLVIGIMSIFFLFSAVKRKEVGHFVKVIGLAAVAGIIGTLVTAVSLLPVYDFAKESKRGGQLVMDQTGSKNNNKVEGNKTKGLMKEYAFQWSYGRAESMSLMFPGIKGYGLHYAERDGEQYIFPKLDEDSHVAQYLIDKNVPEDQAANIAMSVTSDLYWGDQPFTNGPVYLGATICFLFIFAMFYLRGPHKWWILTASLIAILMAMGKNFSGFNNFLFDYLPMYNKFRVPTMTLVIPQLLFPLAAALLLEKLLSPHEADIMKKFKFACIATGAVFVIALFMYFSMDYSFENKRRTAAFSQIISAANDPNIRERIDSLNRAEEQYKDNEVFERFIMQTQGDPAIPRGILAGLRSDRKAAFGGDILRSFVFVVLIAGLIFLYLKNKLNSAVLLVGVGLLVTIDLLQMGMKYLNSYNFTSKDLYETSEFPISEADKAILQDKDPNYRVFNTTQGNPFEESRTSYYHKSIGGYHPAKLGIYDDLVSHQLSGSPNPAVIGMLNVKYIIQRNPQTNSLLAIPNPYALGNAWFVKGVKWVKGPLEEMKALNDLTPKDTAVIDESFRNQVGTIAAADSTATIKQTYFSNDTVRYESNSAGTHLAVFSEIYYKDWKAYIDGKEVPIVKANYVLRALTVPAGKHTIELRFEPKLYYLGKTLTTISSWILTILLLAFLAWKIKGLLDQKKTAR